MEIAAALADRGAVSREVYEDFKASNGWIHRFKKRMKVQTVKLMGEANTLSEEHLQRVLGTFHNDLRELMASCNVPAERIFNADQTGLYYRRYPCTTIVSEERKKHVKGTKMMKDKERITTMCCTSSDGKKVPLAFVGKAANPRCFTGIDQDVTKYYTHNSTAWFRKETTEWWFGQVFGPWYREHYPAGTHLIMILDGCSAHNGIQDWLDTHGLAHIHVITLPPNVTSRFQPMDQGIIAWMKKRYKYGIVQLLLYILDNPERYNNAVASRSGRGKDGMKQGRKPHVFDAIQMSNYYWNEMHQDSVRKCWKVASCLPAVPEEEQEEEEEQEAEQGEEVEDEDDHREEFAEVLQKLREVVIGNTDECVQEDVAGTIFSGKSKFDADDVMDAWDELDSHSNEAINEIIAAVDKQCRDNVIVSVETMLADSKMNKEESGSTCSDDTDLDVKSARSMDESTGSKEDDDDNADGTFTDGGDGDDDFIRVVDVEMIREMDPIDLIDDEIERYLSYTQQLVLHMNVDGQSTKSKTLHRRANDLLSTLAQNIDELKNEMNDSKKEKRKQTTVQSFFQPAPKKPKHKPNVNLV